VLKVLNERMEIVSEEMQFGFAINCHEQAF
jgi:hypothetical protein